MNKSLLYIKRRRGGKNSCANDAMSERVGEVIMGDMRGETCGFLCLAEEVTLHPRGQTSCLIGLAVGE